MGIGGQTVLVSARARIDTMEISLAEGMVATEADGSFRFSFTAPSVDAVVTATARFPGTASLSPSQGIATINIITPPPGVTGGGAPPEVTLAIQILPQRGRFSL
jgi:hypothetical protein